MPNLLVNLNPTNYASYTHLGINQIMGHYSIIIAWLTDQTQADKPMLKLIDDNYQHGGGLHPMVDFKIDEQTRVMTYPGDPPMVPVVTFGRLLPDGQNLCREHITFYPSDWALIDSYDGMQTVVRLD